MFWGREVGGKDEEAEKQQPTRKRKWEESPQRAKSLSALGRGKLPHVEPPCLQEEGQAGQKMGGIGEHQGSLASLRSRLPLSFWP